MNKKLFLLIPVLILLSSFANAALTDDVIAFYHMNESCTADASPNEYNGVNSGASFVNSTDGCDFESTETDYITITSTLGGSWHPTDGGYMCSWSELESAQPYAATISYGFPASATDPNRPMLNLKFDADGLTSFSQVWISGSIDNSVAGSTKSLSSWESMCMEWNSDGKITKFYDGKTNKGADLTNTINVGVVDFGQIGAVSWAGGQSNPFDGKIKNVLISNGTLSQSEVNEWVDGGRTLNIYATPPTTVNDSVESTAVVKQSGSTILLGPTPQTIVASSFNVTGDSADIYGAYSLNVQSTNDNELTCSIYIDGNIEATKVRSNVNGVLGSMFIMTDFVNLTPGEHTQELECARSAGAGQIVLSNAVGIGHFMRDEFGREIIHNETSVSGAVTSGASFTEIDAFNITIGNLTSEDKYNSIVIESALEFTNNDASDELLSAYMSINNSFNCSTYLRDVSAGNTGSVSMDCILENVTQNQTYEIKIYANGTNAAYAGPVIAKNFFLSDEEIAGGAGALVGLTFNGSSNVKLFNLTGGNLNHDLANVFEKMSLSIQTSANTEVNIWIKLINGTTWETNNFTRDFEANVIGVLIGQDSFQDVPEDTYQLEVWANCGGADCTIVGGAGVGYLTDVTTTLLNEFNITAYNTWNGSQILSFNATNGATFSTTNGLIEFFTTEPEENITIQSLNYISQMFLDHNTSQNINASLYQSVTRIHTKQKFTNTTISDATITAETNVINTNNGTLYLNPNLGDLTYTINSTGYFDLTDTITITNFTNETVNLWNSRTEIKLVNASDATAISTFNVTLTYAGITETYQTTNGSAYFNLTQNITYNIEVDAVGFYSNTFTIAPNQTQYTETFEVIKVGNLEIRVFDADDGEAITQLVNFTLTSSTTQQDFNFTGGNFTVTGLTEGSQYSLVFNSNSYSEASFLITYSEDLAKNVFNVFMTKNAVDITFTVLETAGDAIQSANVQVSGFVNGTLQVVAEKVTDGVGQVRFNLMPDEPYFFVFSKDDYITNNVNIVTFETEYTITMQRINLVDFDGPASNVLYAYTPRNESLEDTLQTFNWTVQPQSNASIDEFGIELYFNGSLISSNSLSLAAGGSVQLSYNLSPFVNDTIQVKYYFIKENFTRYEVQVSYDVVDDARVAGSLLDLRNWIRQNVTERDKIVTWFIITSFIAVLIYLFSERNADITTIGTVIAGAINIWVMAFAPITTMIFVSLHLLMFIVYLGEKKRRGQL